MQLISQRQGMFTRELFFDAVQHRLGKHLDPNQLEAVEAASNESLFLVAGPGSGKTTVLTLRVLKLVFVDAIDPASILATTFTRKAAAELRSRILGWGDQLRSALGIDAKSAQRAWLSNLDLNRVFTGTLDSIAEQVLRDFRAAGASPPVVLDEFVARALLFRNGVLGTDAWNNEDLKNYLRTLCADNRVGTTTMGALIVELRQRMIHDRVDRTAFLAAQPPAARALFEVIDAYEAALVSQQALDFALLEQLFFQQLSNGGLSRFTEPLEIVLIDEYQDTNLLQEAIYFALAQAAQRNGGAITVVGDDDQSLYRFRGASVELFRDYAVRLKAATGIGARTIYLASNYRSTALIVDYCSAYVAHDPPYGTARVAGKPKLIAGRQNVAQPFPILTMFRPDRQTLASDLASFIRAVVGPGYRVNTAYGPVTIQIDQRHGTIGDIALLCSTPGEYSSTGKERLPLLLRRALLPQYKVFNPRGQQFPSIESVARVCGLMLECIDPEAVIQYDLAARHHLPDEINGTLTGWRRTAADYIATNPRAPGSSRHRLADFVRAWQRREAQQRGVTWPASIELMKLLYDLITWVPEMQDDAEGLVYLEAITRTMSQAARFSPYDANIRSEPPYDRNSVAAAIRDIFAALAAGEVDVDEELFTSTPRDRLAVLSIHQAKGLEFPLVVVDVCSDFESNHHTQRFRRYPAQPSRAHVLEDVLHQYSPLGAPSRPPLQRAFDDLVRQYFVAFSRPQDVLLLVGLCDPATRQPKTKIPNIALGWDRSDANASGRRWPLVPDITAL
jgi:DNA helicase II / ATP-dependent DNA helicase PcrA